MLCTDCNKRDVDKIRSSCKCFVCLEKRRKKQNEYNQKHRKENIQKATKYYQEHKQQVLNYHHKYYQDNKIIITEKMKDRYINPEKRVKVLQTARDYMNTHKEKVAEIKRRCARAKPEHYIGKAREWRKNHLERSNEILRISKQKRQSKLKDAGGSYTTKEWEELTRKYNYLCLCCEQKKPLEADHIIPVKLNGTNNIDNIQPLCRSCNAKKSAHIIDYRWDVT